MTRFLIKLFVKNDKDVGSSSVRSAYLLMSSIVGILINCLLFIFKLLVGVLSTSVSIVADAFNNISDAGSSIVALVGVKMSNKHADKKHPLGHGRIEYISAFIVAIFIVFIAFELFKSSLDRILNPATVDYGRLALIVLGASILVKLWLFVFYNKIAKKINSQVLKATALDSISDVVASSVVLLCAVITKAFSINIDGYAGLLVAGLIFFAGVKSAKETIAILLGHSPDPKMITEIFEFVKSYEEVVNIHDVMVHDYGPGCQIISFHAEVPADSDFCAVHDVIDEIERDMQAKFGYIVTIHLDPIEINDERVNKMRAFTEEIVKTIDRSFTIHDFRMTFGGNHTNLIFDLVIPVDCKMSDEEVKLLISKSIHEKDASYFAVIKVEHPFV